MYYELSSLIVRASREDGGESPQVAELAFGTYRHLWWARVVAWWFNNTQRDNPRIRIREVRHNPQQLLELLKSKPGANAVTWVRLIPENKYKGVVYKLDSTTGGVCARYTAGTYDTKEEALQGLLPDASEAMKAFKKILEELHDTLHS